MKKDRVLSNENENSTCANALLAVVILFWIQPKKGGKKYEFRHVTNNEINSIEDALDEISSFDSSTTTQALMTRHTIHKKSAVMIAMDELNIETNFDYGVVCYNYC